jgi:hypothetical protein
MAAHRASDRWITPGVVVAFLLVAGALTLATIAAVTYLTARGVDPDPMLRLAAQAVTAVGSLGTLALQLVNRATVTKVERHTGVLAGRVSEAIDALPAPAPAAAPVWDDPTAEHRVPVPAIPPLPPHLMRSPRP